jgi:hypothetical protein
MKATLTPTRGSIWLFAVFPPLILNLGAILLFGGYYALHAMNAPAVQGISPGQVQFAAYVFVCLVEWDFSLLLIAHMAKRGVSLQRMIAPAGNLFDFRKLPALAIFLFVNAVMGAYVWVAAIHNIFLVDKVIMTFILGLGMGFYFVKERNLLPLMFSHFVADLWTFSLSVL